MTPPAKTRSRNISVWQQLAPWLLFLLLAAAAAAFFALPKQREAGRRLQQIKHNETLGLPADYPIENAPLYPGAKVLSCELTDATSTDGKAMDQWDLKAESNDPTDKLLSFYKDFCSSRNMMQTQMISIPTGSSMDYADEKQIIHVEIERPSKAQVTSLKITYYSIRSGH